MMKRGRFIAGAVCGACGAADRIVIEDTVEGRRQRCVACSQSEAMPIDPNTKVNNLRQLKWIASSGVTLIGESGIAVEPDGLREQISGPPKSR